MSTAVAKRYTEEEIERGLTQMALCGGNRRLAAERLEQMGHPIPPDTLRNWAEHRRPDRYAKICAEQAPALAQRIAAEAEGFALELAEAEKATLEVYMRGLHTIKASDAAGALRNITTSKSLNVDRISSPLRGRPNVVIEHREVSELVLKLEQAGVLEGTAVEIEPAALTEVVADQLQAQPDPSTSTSAPPS